MRPSVIPMVKEKLEAYLERVEADYQGQPLATRQPTLPHTTDFKVNVSALAAAIGLRDTQRKYLHERDELRELVDLIAEGQGLLPIGARTQELADKKVKDRLVMQAQAARADAQAAVEAKAREQELLAQLEQANSSIEELQSEVMRLRAQLDMVAQGLYVRVAQ